MLNASAKEIRRELWALVRLTRKGSTIERRQPYFATASVLLTVEWVLPVVLATIALAGPNATGLENFVNLAGTDNYLAFTVIGATTFLWIGWITTVLASDLRLERNLGTLPTIWPAPHRASYSSAVDRSDARFGRPSWQLAHLRLRGHFSGFPWSQTSDQARLQWSAVYWRALESPLPGPQLS